MRVCSRSVTFVTSVCRHLVCVRTVTLMTAGLVVALWALAGEAFTSMFQDAMNKVRGAG